MDVQRLQGHKKWKLHVLLGTKFDLKSDIKNDFSFFLRVAIDRRLAKHSKDVLTGISEGVRFLRELLVALL